MNKHLPVAYYKGLSYENKKVKSVLFSLSLKLDDRRYLRCSPENLTPSYKTFIVQVEGYISVKQENPTTCECIHIKRLFTVSIPRSLLKTLNISITVLQENPLQKHVSVLYTIQKMLFLRSCYS